MNGSSTDIELLRQASAGDGRQLGQLLAQYRPRLHRMVRLRLDARVQRRIDASDVLQEAFAEVGVRLSDYLRQPTMPFFVWVRFLVGQKILQLHRHHLGVKARDACREISLHHGSLPQASSAHLAAQLIDGLTAPSQGAIKAEMRLQLQEALNRLEPIDREILALRHFEHLTMAEAAEVLGIKLTAACNRYVRALARLKQEMPREIRELWE
ncbi:MAG: sigma-70 family RNA polymerase sigma factor [Pirellulaceae bacterium]|nr:sigma-70 family RNA polymerase sigma factor [Pirellulaceae bacterium]